MISNRGSAGEGNNYQDYKLECVVHSRGSAGKGKPPRKEERKAPHELRVTPPESVDSILLSAPTGSPLEIDNLKPPYEKEVTGNNQPYSSKMY